MTTDPQPDDADGGQMHFFKRHWDEARGDEHDHWGTSTWYFETGPDMWPTRQIEVYANGTVLHYDEGHIDDDFGGLAETALDPEDFAPFAIGHAELRRRGVHRHRSTLDQAPEGWVVAIAVLIGPRKWRAF